MVLDSLSDEQKSLFLAIATIRSFSVNDVLVARGEKRGVLFIIKNGSVELRKNLGSRQYKVLKKLERGDFFGELSFFKNSPERADVVAISDGEIIEVSMSKLDDLCRREPDIGIIIYRNMMHDISLRLKKSSENLKKAMDKALKK